MPHSQSPRVRTQTCLCRHHSAMQHATHVPFHIRCCLFTSAQALHGFLLLFCRARVSVKVASFLMSSSGSFRKSPSAARSSAFQNADSFFMFCSGIRSFRVDAFSSVLSLKYSNYNAHSVITSRWVCRLPLVLFSYHLFDG